jgi:hypothetical protein
LTVEKREEIIFQLALDVVINVDIYTIRVSVGESISFQVTKYYTFRYSQ